jgi:hypothetical protein
MKTKNMTTLSLRKSIDRSPLRVGFLLIPFTLVCFGLSPQARAVCQEGCLTNENTVLGEDALVNDSRGLSNTAIGFNALHDDTGGLLAGGFNTATGAGALASNTTGLGNTAIGAGALEFNTTGNGNTAIGQTTLDSNTTGSSNIAVGGSALFNNTTGGQNTAIGQTALSSNSTGGSNVAVGWDALFSKITGSFNIALGAESGSRLITGSNNIYIGSIGATSEFRTIRIGATPTHGRTFIAGVSGVTVAGGVGVIVDNNGQLGTVVSSERFKDGIKPMDKASEAILALKPVTFRYKHELDPKGIPQFGLVAEDVDKVNSDLVARDDQGKPYTVRYEAVNAMLLNEFLKEHKAFLKEQRKVEEQEAMIAQQQKQIEALTAGLQKVSAELEMSKSTPQTVSNNH